MKGKIMTKASRLVNKAGFQIKKHSPEILMGAGIVGTVASTVLACKATTKVGKILEETKEMSTIINSGVENGNINGREYTEQDGKKDLTIVYAQTGLKVAKLYAPAVILGALSITSIVAGHRILKKRNIALAAAYAVVDKGFKNYRKNVVDRFGEELDKELRYNIKSREVEVESTDEEGNKVVNKEIVSTMNPVTDRSDYAKFFDAASDQFEKDAEYNLLFLRKQQEYANDLLRCRGYVFLNEVYEMLGIQKTKAGQVVGWIYDEKNPTGDNYIDFGIYNFNDEANRRFVNGYEYNILLDFNVDGVIYDKVYDEN